MRYRENLERNKIPEQAYHYVCGCFLGNITKMYKMCVLSQELFSFTNVGLVHSMGSRTEQVHSFY